MPSIDSLLDEAIKDGHIPGAVLLARDKNGLLSYAKVSGKASVKPGEERLLELGSVFKLASSSKLVTTIAVLQIIERGLIGWDDDVSHHIPVLAKQEILTGFNWFGKPQTKKRTQPITLRHLLTQTAGTGYDFFDIQSIWRYKWWYKLPIATGDTLEQRLDYPLLNEPGDGWTYGSGISWAGRVLEKVAGISLESWVQKYISQPLELTTLTFFPLKEERIVSQLVEVSLKDANGLLTHSSGQNLPESKHDCLGGEGLYASLEDFMAILVSLLVDDEKLLKKETAAKMFQPQLSKVERKGVAQCLALPTWICRSILVKDQFDWGVGGVLVDGDSHEYLKRGTLMWLGMFHTLWWIDRVSGVCGVFGAQLLPRPDASVVSLIRDFQREVYSKAACNALPS